MELSVSLELAKRLKDLGVKQESYFYWCLPREGSNGGLPVYYTLQDKIRLEKSFYWPVEEISAFTVAELGEMLPKKITINNVDYYFTQIPCRDLKTWSIFYRNDFCGMPNCDFYDENEANARAKMLIYLLENNLITKEEIK